MVLDGYLADFGASIRSDWYNGENWTDAAMLQVQFIDDLVALDLESIETFYEARDADEQASRREVRDSEGDGASEGEINAGY